MTITDVAGLQEVSRVDGLTPMRAADGHLFHAGLYRGVWELAEKHNVFPAEVLAPRTVSAEQVEAVTSAMRVWLLGLGSLTLNQVNDLAPKFALAALAAMGFEVRNG